MTNDNRSVLFVCTGNAGRSQMSQALLSDRMDSITIESAGVDPWEDLHPMALKLLTERGILLPGQHPKHVNSVSDRPFDLVVTIGDPARALLPKAHFSGSYWQHWDISDPADADDTPDSEAVFVRTFERIESRMADLIQYLTTIPAVSEYSWAPGTTTGIVRDVLDPSEFIPAAADAGFRAIELNLFKGPQHFDYNSKSAVSGLRAIADDHGILISSIHSPDMGGPIPLDDPEDRRQRVELLKRCLELADTLGSTSVPTHDLLRLPFSESPDASERYIHEFVADLTPEAEASLARIAFENPCSTTDQAASCQRLLERLDDMSSAAFGFVLDTGHANVRKDLPMLHQSMGAHLISVHLNDNDGNSDQHTAPGEGTMDCRSYRKLFEDVAYDGVMMYEVLCWEGDWRDRLNTTMAAHRKYFAHTS